MSCWGVLQAYQDTYPVDSAPSLGCASFIIKSYIFSIDQIFQLYFQLIFSIHCFFAEGKKVKWWLGMMKKADEAPGPLQINVLASRDPVRQNSVYIETSSQIIIKSFLPWSGLDYLLLVIG